MIVEDELRKLMKIRRELIDKDQVDSKKADALMEQILIILNKSYSDLSVEAILEGYTSVGAAPCLLYDDHGRFAVLSEGFQSVNVEEHGDFEGLWTGEKEDWKSTVREAINWYASKGV